MFLKGSAIANQSTEYREKGGVNGIQFSIKQGGHSSLGLAEKGTVVNPIASGKNPFLKLLRGKSLSKSSAVFLVLLELSCGTNALFYLPL